MVEVTTSIDYASIWAGKEVSCPFNVLEFQSEVKLRTQSGKLEMTFTFPKNMKNYYAWTLISSSGLSPKALFQDHITAMTESSIHCQIEPESIVNYVSVPNNLQLCGKFSAPLAPLASLLCIFDNPHYADFFVNVQGITLNLNKCILAATSPIIMTMVDNGIHTIDETDSSVEVVKACFRFMYDGVHSIPEMIDLLEIAKKYEMLQLQLHCEEKLSLGVTVEDCVEKLKVAQDNDFRFMTACILAALKKVRGQVIAVHKRKLVDVFGLDEGLDIISKLSN